MDIVFLSPEYPNKGGFPLAPPVLEYLAALTLRLRPEATIQLIDANREAVQPEDIDASLIGISIMTPTAPWAYAFSDAVRRRGKKVVLGGIHASARPEEALAHADAVVVGEAESVWSDVLHDAERGRLGGIYHGQRLPLVDLPTPLRMLRGHYPFRAVFTSRGCINKCTFCSVRTFFGDTVRFRSNEDVARDIDRYAGRIYYNGDDNIWGSNIERSISLFRELAGGKKRWWFGQGDLATVQRPKGDLMLHYAYESGLRSVWVGYESDSESTLNTYRAASKQGASRRDAIRKIMDQGIEVVLFLILGGRNDQYRDFDKALELSDSLRVTIHPILLTPYPATELYEEYRKYLIPGIPWNRYDGAHALFEHDDADMTVASREGKLIQLNRDLFTRTRITRRIAHINHKGFPVSHLISFMAQAAMRRGFNRVYAEYMSDTHPG